MDIIFETPEGIAFSIEIGFFDTVLEIKEKVQKYQGIPVARQTLVFNGQVLEDERDVEYCLLFQDCRVQLLIADEPQVMEINEQESSPSKKIQLKIKTPTSNGYVPLEMDEEDTVLQLKEKIHEMEPIPTILNRFLIDSNGAELQDHQSLRDCGFTDDAEINVSVKPTAICSGTVEINEEESSPSKKIQLKIKTPSSDGYVPLEMDEDDTVLQLKEKIHEMEPIPTIVNRFLRDSKGAELQDHQSLRDCGFTDDAEINVSVKPTAICSGTVEINEEESSPSKKIQLKIKTPSSDGYVPLEMDEDDTVLQLKEKIYEMEPIPTIVNRFLLDSNGAELQDHQSLRDCGFTDDAEINVSVKPTAICSGTVEINEEESSPSKKIQLKIKTPSSDGYVPLEMDEDDTVLQLKEKIHEMEPIPVNRLVLQSNRAELQDHRSLRDCELTDNAEIDVFIKPTAIRSGAGSSKRAEKGTKRLKVMVLPWRGTVKIPVEVNPLDNVEELRKELEKLQQRRQINLPVEGYFFIHKQSILDDDKSFRLQDVANGDTIEIFRGRVTNG